MGSHSSHGSRRRAMVHAMTTLNSPTSGNLYEALRAGFPSQLDATAIETADTPAPLHYSWRDLDHGSARMANLLASLDLPPRSRVAVQVDKSVEAVMLYLAVLRAGHVYLPLNAAYQSDELAHFITDAEPAVLVCTPARFGKLSKLAFQRDVGFVFTLGDDRSGTLLDRAAQHADIHSAVPTDADDLAAIVYTSGTTGRSKGACLSHRNLLSNAQTLRHFWGWDAPPPGGDVLLHALPIFHVHGLFVALHAALLSGSRMVWFNRFDARAVLHRLPEATVFMGVPTMYTRLLAEPGLNPAVCGRMRLFLAGSAPLLPDTFAQWQQRTGHTILERYGMSETVMLTSNPYQPARDRRVGSVGMALPGVGVRVAAPLGEVGGIEVRGPNVFSGYWRLPDKTREEFTADAWFKTGDMGRFDADGYLFIVGRSKDLVISGGYNVYPAEIEALLNELPGVQESAVIGVPHPDFGEAVVAVIIPRSGATFDGEALQHSLKGRIANFKVPKRVIVQSELPRNAMGKVQKNLLRQQFVALFT